jgi:pimeloyl-ACP methyl ester carboxylesterase
VQPGLSKIGRMLAAGLATMVFAGCSAGPSPATSAAAPLVGEECPDLVDGGTQVRFTDAHGAELTGVTLGTGRTGVVLAHMSDGDVCGWLAYARQIARDGYRVMVFYFHGFGTSGGADGSTLDGDVLAAAEYLRGHGAQPIALLGASMGGTASLVAATELRPPPAVVISLSAPKYYQGLDALAAAAKLTVPVLYAAGVSDNDYADQAQALYDATPGTDRTILLAPTTAHGTGMVGAPGSQVRDAMDKALRERAPAGG